MATDADRDEASLPVNSKQRPGLVSWLREWGHIAFVENAALKFVALVLALTVFVLVQSEESEVYHPWVRVTYSQGDARVLTSTRVDQVQISVRGTRRRVKRLQKRRLENIRVDLQQLSTGELRLDPEMFSLPEGLELVSINPPSIYLEFDERDQKSVPVIVDVHGTPARGFKLASQVSLPKQVQISGARRRLSSIHSIATEKIELTGRTQNFKGDVNLLAENFEIIGSPRVTVSIEILEDFEQRQLGEQQVTLRIADGGQAQPGQFKITPSSVRVTIFGPVNALDAVVADRIKVYADVTDSDLALTGPKILRLNVEPALADIGYKVEPTSVSLSLSN